MNDLEKLACKYVDEKPENDGFYDAFIAGYNEAYSKFEGGCEWIIDIDFGGMGYPGCISNQKIQIIKVDYKFCPFCGRKIKRI